MNKTEYTTLELQEKFNVLGFMMGFCVVEDKETREKGSFEFSHSPRVYFNYRKYEIINIDLLIDRVDEHKSIKWKELK